ncbi:MAG TPA: precorrin-6y C5,15-methyltransferase (decarboxylating) subunit CbiE [Acidisphaera sp.]|nr:precorrin-6y C5,15-methyltransferase (decarboxylating) subunit CbiE [Acidisphaera sp.]
MKPWLSVIGIGEDGVDGLSARARALIEGAALVAGGVRHLALAAPLIRGERLAWPSPLRDALPAIAARRGTPVAVLASGDPNWFGVGETLRGIVAAEETLCIPAPSSLALACARLGWAAHDVAAMSACGRPLEAVVSVLHDGARVIVLSADARTPAALAALLCERGCGASVLHVMEALGGPHECIRRLGADATIPDDINPLNLVAVEVAGRFCLPLASLSDDAFAHDGQITKREVRAATLSALAPRPGALLWDIGCGSGSVAIEWSRAHPACRAVAIEPRPDRAERAMANARALGVPELRVVVGRAPDALDGLPLPDAVFIGGGARDPGVIDGAWHALRPGGMLVVNSVTVETQALLIETRSRLGGTLTRLAIERLDTVGDSHLHGFRPAMAVMQWAVRKPWDA